MCSSLTTNEVARLCNALNHIWQFKINYIHINNYLPLEIHGWHVLLKIELHFETVLVVHVRICTKQALEAYHKLLYFY